jgi:DNA replication protein DnaC
MSATTMVAPEPSLAVLLRALKLPTFARLHEDIAQKAEQEGWSFAQYLRHLAMLEVEERRCRRIARNLKSSQLPGEKTLATLRQQRLPASAAKRLPTLCEGGFVERGDNVLIFGLPGRGKTHVACAIGHELVRRGRRVLFVPTYALVQRLLNAKRELLLEKELAHLDRFDAVILDDIGYVQQDRDEMEVLFTFLAQRYERKSVVITSNLVFSEWDRIFKDPMTTAAAIDRLVHHATIVEMVGKSVRAEEAAARAGGAARRDKNPTAPEGPATTTKNRNKSTKGTTTTKKRKRAMKDSTTTGEM